MKLGKINILCADCGEPMRAHACPLANNGESEAARPAGSELACSEWLGRLAETFEREVSSSTAEVGDNDYHEGRKDGVQWCLEQLRAESEQ